MIIFTLRWSETSLAEIAGAFLDAAKTVVLAALLLGALYLTTL
jgi:hypothetical protein